MKRVKSVRLGGTLQLTMSVSRIAAQSGSELDFATDDQSVRLGIEPLCDSWPNFGCS